MNKSLFPIYFACCAQFFNCHCFISTEKIINLALFAPAEFHKELFYYCWLNFIIKGGIYCPLNKSDWLSIKVWYDTAYLFTEDLRM